MVTPGEGATAADAGRELGRKEKGCNAKHQKYQDLTGASRVAESADVVRCDGK